MIAEYKNSTTYFVHQDHLGSTRLVTGLNLAVVQNLDYFPHGEPNSTDSGITTQEFTGDESDAESGLDHTQFRQYSSPMARWMTPDPAGLAAVNPTNPQSWNRYAYALNNPLLFVDRIGLYCEFYGETFGDETERRRDRRPNRCGGMRSSGWWLVRCRNHRHRKWRQPQRRWHFLWVWHWRRQWQLHK
jgi:RHS repeat-associated protein